MYEVARALNFVGPGSQSVSGRRVGRQDEIKWGALFRRLRNRELSAIVSFRRLYAQSRRRSEANRSLADLDASARDVARVNPRLSVSLPLFLSLSLSLSRRPFCIFKRARARARFIARERHRVRSAIPAGKYHVPRHGSRKHRARLDRHYGSLHFFSHRARERTGMLACYSCRSRTHRESC